MSKYPFVTYNPEGSDGKIQIRRTVPRDHTHQHKLFELVYVVRGTAKRRIQDATIPVAPGDYYVADPFSAHGHEDIQDCEIIGCLFLPEYIDRALADCPSISSLLSHRMLHFGVPVDIPLADRVLHDTDGSVGRIMRKMEREHGEARMGYMEMLR